MFVGADNVMKLADFGLARQLDSADALWSQDWGGSPSYWAPEVEKGHGLKTQGRFDEAKKDGAHGLNADVWSMGKLVKKIAERFGQSSDFETLVKFACVKDRALRPTSTRLQEFFLAIDRSRGVERSESSVPASLTNGDDESSSLTRRTASKFIDSGFVEERRASRMSSGGTAPGPP